MKPIPLFKPTFNTEELLDDLRPIFNSGWVGLGPKTKEFEEELCNYLNCEYAVGLNSGTAALHIACEMMELAGKYVITTPLTFISTNAAIRYANGIPLFCDVNDDGCLDPDKVIETIQAVGERSVGAIMVVNFGGRPCDIRAFEQIESDYGIPIIYDNAHAFGAKYESDKLGSFEELSCFSFHAVKNLGLGDGGAFVTSNERYYQKALKLRWMGIDKSTFQRTDGSNYNWLYGIEELGYKYHMNDITATIGLSQLKKVDVENHIREVIATNYDSTLLELNNKGLINFMGSRSVMFSSANHLYAICLNTNTERNNLHDYLKSKGITTGVHYNTNEDYKFLSKLKRHLPVARRISDTILSLPMFPDMTKTECEYVSEAIAEYFDNK